MLRRQFLDEFVARPPRFVIDVTTGRASVWGEDTSYSFPELEGILERDYVALFLGDGYRILGRRPTAPGLQPSGAAPEDS